MGNATMSSSRASLSNSKKSILEDYIPKKKITDQRYGEATLLQHKLSKDFVILKELTTNDSKEYISTSIKWQNRVEMQHPNIVQVLGIEKKEESQYCSKFFKTFLLFEYIKNDLNEEIAAKIIEDSHFLEEDIWFFLYCLLNGLLYYKAFNVSHGDLQPSNIFLSQSAVYKIVDHTLFNNVSSYMQLQWNSNSSHTKIYLSPDLMKSLEKDLVQPLHNPFKSDIFTLGMIVLHLATLENCDLCYDFISYQVKYEEIHKKLAILRKKYGEKLFFFVKGMLIEDELERPDYEDLLKMLNGSYETQSDMRFKELANQPIKIPDATLINSKTFGLVNSKKIAEKDESLSIESKPIVNNKFFENIMQKAINQKEIEHEVKANEPSDEDDDYLNAILMKEGLARNPEKLKKKEDELSYSDSTSNPAPRVLKQSNKPNLSKKNIQKVKKEDLFKIERKIETNEFYENGAKYEGEKLNNKKHGKGVFYYSDGGRYEGEWRDDMMSGYGILYYPEGTVAYKGYWTLDKFHGYGILNNKNPKKGDFSIDWSNFEKYQDLWTSYEGDFRVDNKEGYGLLYFCNGEKYIGEFKNDKICGEGNFYARNGNIVNGKWENNVYVEE